MKSDNSIWYLSMKSAQLSYILLEFTKIDLKCQKNLILVDSADPDIIMFL